MFSRSVRRPFRIAIVAAALVLLAAFGSYAITEEYYTNPKWSPVHAFVISLILVTWMLAVAVMFAPSPTPKPQHDQPPEPAATSKPSSSVASRPPAHIGAVYTTNPRTVGTAAVRPQIISDTEPPPAVQAAPVIVADPEDRDGLDRLGTYTAEQARAYLAGLKDGQRLRDLGDDDDPRQSP